VRTVRAIRGLWRWRHNPLRRTTDLAEAWVALAALLLMVLAAPVAGVLAGGAADDALERSVRDQREARHRVTATVVRELDRSPLDVDPETAAAGDLRSRVLADWTAPDGTRHRGPLLAGLDAPHAGDRFAIWTDEHGRLAARPLDPATATTHAVLAGFGATLATAGLTEGARRLIVWRMVRRRYARLDQAWDRAGPDWGRTGTGI
jgi:F0F1-type ATP synthase membrane subunit c/vacuolar-type H+-ATPase subunit K